MNVDELSGTFAASAPRPIARRQLLKLTLLLAGAAGASTLLAACGGGTAPAAPTSAAPAVAPTPPPPPAAPTKPPAEAAAPTPPPAAVATAPAAVPTVPAAASPKPAAAATAAPTTAPAGTVATINVKAFEKEESFLFDVDTLAVPAGPVKVAFTNGGKMTHEVFLYPTQDLTAMMALKRADQDAGEADFIKGLVGSAEDIEPGKSAVVEGVLKPGFYELACFIRGKRPDGSTFVHFDKGQTVTIAAFGPGGPGPDIATASSTMRVQLAEGEGELSSSWVFLPDRLVMRAGDASFKVTNGMKEEHDFLVYQLGNISEFIATRLGGEEPEASTIRGEMLLEDLPAGQTGEKSMKLTPGMWCAACFIVSKNADGSSFVHRDRAQRFTFLVK